MKRIAVFTAVVVALALPAIAVAKTFKQEGGIVGDKKAKVTLKVKKSGGEVQSVVNFKARAVLTRCERNGSVRFLYRAITPIEVNDNNRFRVKLRESGGGGTVLWIAGKVKNNGRKTVGNLKTNTFKVKGHGDCRTPKQRFKTSV